MTAPGDLSGRVAGVAVADTTTASAIVARLARAHARVRAVELEPLPEDSGLEQVQDAVENLANAEGRLDIWVQSISIGSPGLATELELDAWSRSLAATAGFALAAARGAGRSMLQRKSGSIVFLVSVDGLFASAGRAAPSCGAAAVMMLARTLACEWAASGVRVNAIATTSWLAPPLGPEAVEATAAGVSVTRIPLARQPHPDELAEAVLYLASPQSSFVTGEILRVDGGWAGYQLF